MKKQDSQRNALTQMITILEDNNGQDFC